MILSLLTLLGGGAMRLLPELIGLWNKKTDNQHELALMDKQIQLEQTKSAMRQQEIETQGRVDMDVAQLTALSEALKSQMQVTGNKIVDALNFLVRPITTYYFLGIYGLAKIAMFIIAVKTGISGWEAILKVYDIEDRAILSGILSFWFVGRVFDKSNK